MSQERYYRRVVSHLRFSGANESAGAYLRLDNVQIWITQGELVHRSLSPCLHHTKLLSPQAGVLSARPGLVPGDALHSA